MPTVRFYTYRWERRHCEDNSTKMRYTAILAAVTIGASRKGGKVVANRPGLLYDQCILTLDRTILPEEGDPMRRDGLVAMATFVSVMVLILCGCEKELRQNGAGDTVAVSQQASNDKPVLRIATNDNYYAAKSYTDNCPYGKRSRNGRVSKSSGKCFPGSSLATR